MTTISAEHTIELRKNLLYKSIEMQIAEYGSTGHAFVLSLERAINTTEAMFHFITNKLSIV